MPLVLGQLVYTSFPVVGFKRLASVQVPKNIQQAFIQCIAYRYWDAYNPPDYGYRAIYLHQVAPEQHLFGWLYNDGLDDLGRSHVPYFICYYLAASLNAVQLENIFTYLFVGPVALTDRQSLPASLETIVVPDLCSYQSARPGVAIPPDIREQCHIALKQEKLLELFVPVDGGEIVINLNRYTHSQTDLVACTHNLGEGGELSSVDRDFQILNSLVAAAQSRLKDKSAQPLRVQKTSQVEHDVATGARLSSPRILLWGLGAAVIVMVIVSFSLLKAWKSLISSPPSSRHERIAAKDELGSSNNQSVLAFPLGTPKGVVEAALGKPTKTTRGYWSNTNVALYELLPNQITLSYVFDRYSSRTRQTEVFFARSIEPQVMLATLNGMLGGKATKEVQQGLKQVQQRQLTQYSFATGSVEGIIQRIDQDTVYIGIWESDLHL